MAGCAYAAAAKTLVKRTFPTIVSAVATRAVLAAGPRSMSTMAQTVPTTPRPAPRMLPPIWLTTKTSVVT